MTSSNAAKPKKGSGGHRPNTPKPPGGKRRTAGEIFRLVGIAEELVLLGMPWYRIAAALGQAAGKPKPFSRRMTDIYIGRVRQRHLDNPLPGLTEARQDAERRYQGTISRLRGTIAQLAQEPNGRTKHAGLILKHEAAVLAWETRLAALRGMDAPRDKEAIEAAALIIVTEKIQRIRQEREQQATLREDQEAKRQRELEAIDVPAVPAEGNGHGSGHGSGT